MTTPANPTGRDAFIAYLAQLAAREDRAALAALRRGLGKPPGTVVEMLPYVMPFIGEHASLRRQDDCFLVASLFAAHQLMWQPAEERREPTNLGASFRWLDEAVRRQQEVTNDGKKSTSAEKRFVALLNAERENLPEHLRHAVSLLKAHEVPVDWEQLLRDLHWWDSDYRSVQRAWAQAYWRSADGRADGRADPSGDAGQPAT